MDKQDINNYDKVIEIFKKILLVGTGLSLFVVGLVSLLFPFLPGSLLIFLGLTFGAKGSQSIAKSSAVIKSLKFLGCKIEIASDFIKKIARKK